MRGTRKKALRRELIALIGRAPMKQGALVPRYDANGVTGGGIMQVVKDEFRVYKRAWRETRRG